MTSPFPLEPLCHLPAPWDMALPSGFVEELKTRLSLSDVVGRKVVWDNRKSQPAKGDYWAPCPFHQEKTASFHVDDRKGFYYCFGCHAKGDALNFVRETENMGFMEAVELLAREAGMPVPAPDPAARAAQEARAGLADIMEMALRFYRTQLRGARAGQARDYLAGRGLNEAALDRFEIGYSPEGRTVLLDHLKAKSVSVGDMDKAGLVIVPDDGGAPYDRFRDRIMFPIRDGRGRAIAFGGRAMSDQAKAKYLNSPETPLFHKGSALYHHGPAREAAGKAGTVIVAEGYMDVIALAMHGFVHSVAPLGTAITEDQLRLMWKMADEPILALDGDKAGLRAAMRLVDVALPMLEPGKTLRFALLPEGQDPDDLLRQSGRAAMTTRLDDAVTLFDLLWRRETEETPLDSPERRAGFDARLKAAISRIANPTVRAHYEAEARHRRRALYSPSQPKRTAAPGRRQVPYGKGRRPTAPAYPLAGTRSSPLAGKSANADIARRIRERTIAAICLSHPHLALEIEGQLDRLPLADEQARKTMNALLGALGDKDAVAALKIIEFDALTSLGHVRANPYIQPDADGGKARNALAEAVALHRTTVARETEVRDGQVDMDNADESLTYRIAETQKAAATAALGTDETADDAEEKRQIMDHFQSLIDGKG